MFYNRLTNEFNLSDSVVRKRLHYVSLPENFNEYEDYVRYAQANPPGYNPDTHIAVEIVPTEIDGVWTQQWQIDSLPQDRVDENFRNKKTQKLGDVSAAKEQRLAQGFEFEFADGTGKVQTRNSDLRNIQTLVMSALSDSDATFQFRCADNKMHDMSAAQMIDLGKAAQAHLTQTQAWAWGKKQEVADAKTFEELAAL